MILVLLAAYIGDETCRMWPAKTRSPRPPTWPSNKGRYPVSSTEDHPPTHARAAVDR